jgi:hypothetical protein
MLQSSHSSVSFSHPGFSAQSVYIGQYSVVDVSSIFTKDSRKWTDEVWVGACDSGAVGKELMLAPTKVDDLMAEGRVREAKAIFREDAMTLLHHLMVSQYYAEMEEDMENGVFVSWSDILASASERVPSGNLPALLSFGDLCYIYNPNWRQVGELLSNLMSKVGQPTFDPDNMGEEALTRVLCMLRFF